MAEVICPKRRLDYGKISLRELLNYVDFDYEIIKNDNEDYTDEFDRGVELIKLIDQQDAYLGNMVCMQITHITQMLHIMILQ